MKALAWVLVGLSAGLLVPPAVAQTYNYFYSGKQILAKQVDKQGSNTNELLRWADKIWRQNTSQVATEAMFLLACIRFQ